ncbi:hypothetical protein Btru_065186 [Bulinus truncatus]|nr:hypothetical protein Btru_065186 [Bulinus truncatus]
MVGGSVHIRLRPVDRRVEAFRDLPLQLYYQVYTGYPDVNIATDLICGFPTETDQVLVPKQEGYGKNSEETRVSTIMALVGYFMCQGNKNNKQKICIIETIVIAVNQC